MSLEFIDGDFETKSGTVNKVSFAIKNSSHSANFLLSNRPVEIQMDNPIFISNGDNITVAGFGNSNILTGTAYKNHTTGVTGTFNTNQIKLIKQIIFFLKITLFGIPAARKLSKFIKGVVEANNHIEKI